MAGPGYFDVLPERTRLRGEYGDYRPCGESGLYATRCTLPPMRDYAHHDGSDDSSWTDRWRDEGPRTRTRTRTRTMPEPIKEAVFTVARGGKAISSYVVDQSEAINELHRIESNMRAAMLEPDVTLATVVKTTTYGDPEPVKP